MSERARRAVAPPRTRRPGVARPRRVERSLPSIRAGAAFVYRVYDVAETIDLRAVEMRLRSPRGPAPALAHARIAPGRPEALIIKDAPIRVSLGERQIELAGVARTAGVSATIWSYGALSVRFQFPLHGLGWRELARIARTVSEAPLDNWNGSTDYCRALLTDIQAAVQRPAISPLIEDYTIYALRELTGITSADELLARTDLPALLLGEEPGSLSARVRAGTLGGLFQYGTRDATVIDWDSAVIFEPGSPGEVADILEFALTHMLELRVYDELLDQRLVEFYGAIEAGRDRVLRNPFAAVARDASARYIEFSALTERIDNSLKVVGDYYLATIFRGAIQRFRIPDWQQSLARKMNILSSVSSLLQGEINVRRGHLLELVVILLILLELIFAATTRFA